MLFAKLCFFLLFTCIHGKTNEVCSAQDCFCTIGMRDSRIKDEDITASSTWRRPNAFLYRPAAARLDNQLGERGNAGSTGSWSALQNRVGEWIQVYLHQPTRLTGIVTQGRPVRYSQWVTSFKIFYGDSTNQLQVMLDGYGNELVFEGNNDNNSYSTNKFPQPIVARYIRLYPQSWHNHISLRMEFLTC